MLKLDEYDPIKELARMLYKDLVESGDTPQEALDKVVRGVSPLTGQDND